VSRTMRLASRVFMWACLLAPLPHDLSRACTHATVLGRSSRCKWLRKLMWCWFTWCWHEGITALNPSKGDLRFVRPDAAGYMPPGRWHQHGKLMPGIRASRLLLQPIHNDGITDAKCGNKQLIIKLYGGVGAGRGRREQAHGREDKTFSLENVHWFSS
jgi:hypothetical protein